MSDENKAFELRTDNERPTLKIDDATYHFRVRDDLSMREIAFVQFAGKRIGVLQDELQNSDSWSEEKADELEELVDRVARVVLHDVPDDILGKLSDMQKLNLIEAFSETANLGGTDSRDTAT